MAWFRRKRRAAVHPPTMAVDREDTPSPSDDDAAADAGEVTEARGPFDVSEVPDLGERIDLGVLRVPQVEGMQAQIGLDSTKRAPVGITVTLGDSALQLQVFAAPKSRGIWNEVRAERAEMLAAQSATVTESYGPHGHELLAEVPVTTPAGSGVRPMRFVGVDGSRWLLLATFFGPAAKDPTRARSLEDLLADVVVARGDRPYPPKRIIPLTLPGQPESNDARPSLQMPSRGPEIQETR
ncbi:MAG: DUF3710 domain-containing protein [Bowdeniella nasicola]|nr:DUF3710 domain-containing protein [Bowdeniella nasicola]